MSQSLVNKYIKKYFTLENVIFVLILSAIVFYLFFQVVILKTANPQVAVTTTSMVPTYEGYDLHQDPTLQSRPYLFDIFRGDLLIVQNIQPKVGDVIVFKVATESTPVVHRVVAEIFANGTQYFATKGDHNSVSDAGNGINSNNFGWIPRDEVLGVVVFSIHYLGWFSLQLQDPYIRTFLIIATLGIIVLTVYESFGSDDKSKNKSNENSKLSIKRTVFLKYNSHSFRINRSRLYAFSFILLIFLTFFGTGLVNYATGKNTVSWVRSGADEEKGLIDLHSQVAENPYVVNNNDLYFYNYHILITSSGSLNFVSKVTVQAVYNNFTAITNPKYVWTIVYDYYGSKLINSILLFELPLNTSGHLISATLTFTVYSSGILANPPKTTHVGITVLV